MRPFRCGFRFVCSFFFLFSFPIVATGPGIVANLWGIFYFKEIRGKKNLLTLLGAFAVTFVGILLIGLSKQKF